MSETAETSKQQRLAQLFQKLLPLVDSVADWFRLIFILGLVTVLWIGFWMLKIQHLPMAVSLSLLGMAFLPLLIIGRFWWALLELKDLPNITGTMLTDVKSGLLESTKDIKVTKLGFLGATKGLWSIGSLLSDARDLLGSYVSLATLLNPFMLGLGVISLGLVFLFLLIGIVLVIMVL